MRQAVLNPSTSRYDALDALRGVAMVWMTAFHFCFDLNHFGYLRQDFYRDPLWTWQRTAIVSLFLLCAGIGQAVAASQQQTWARFWRRWVQIAACALLVSLGSWWMYPGSFIYFGVLHGMAVMLLLVRLSAGWGHWRWWLGAIALAVPWAAPHAIQAWPQAAVLNERWLNWLGLISYKPRTEDYVPLLPWLGVMWWGMALGQWLLRERPAALTQPLGRAGRALAWLGRWSLTYYMLHQPVLIGLLAGFSWLGGPR